MLRRVRVRGRMKRKNIDKCRTLRKNQTDAERKLWSVLRNRQLSGTKFRRQFPIGKYILDFYSPEYKLGIEAGGGQHYEEKGKLRDQQRNKELSRLGVKVIRFNDRDILKNTEGVYRIILENIEKKRLSPPHLLILSPEGRGKKVLSPLWGES
jgi:very-short-patch-repair endonuclease